MPEKKRRHSTTRRASRVSSAQAPLPTVESFRTTWNMARYLSRTKRTAVTGILHPYGVAVRLEGQAERIEEAVRDLFADPGTKALRLADDPIRGLVQAARARRRPVKGAQLA